MRFLTHALYWLSYQSENLSEWARHKAGELSYSDEATGTPTTMSEAAKLIPQVWEKALKKQMQERMAMFDMVERVDRA